MNGNRKVMALLLCVLFVIAPFISMVGTAKTVDRSTSRSTNHVVLGEVMTGTWCTWCKYAEQAFDLLIKDSNYFDKRLVMIEWHNNDAYSIPEEAARMAYYGGTGYPMAVFDGHYGMAGAANDGTGNYTKGTLDAYKAMIDPRPVAANTSISINLGISGGKLYAWVNATLLQDTTHTNLKVWAVLVDDENFWDGLYPIRMTAKAKIFATSVTISKAGDVGKASGSVNIDSSWDLGRMRVVGFIQSDADGFVLQAGISTPPPTLKGSPTVTMNENTVDKSLTMDNLFTDPMGKAFTYYGAVGSAHINASVDPTTHVVSISPWNNWSGTENIYLQVADNTSMPSNGKIPVTVTHVNQAPVRIGIIPVQTMKEGTTKSNAFNLVNYFYDVDDLSLTYTASGAKNVTTKITTGQVSITAPVGFNGQDKITFKATDAGGLSAWSNCTVTVTDVNFPPTKTKQIADITMPGDSVDKSIKLNQYFSDVDNPVLQFNVTGNTNVNTAIGTDSTLTLAPKLYWHGSETLTVSATDGVNNPISQSFLVMVTAVNHAPKLTGGTFESVQFNENTDYTTTKTVNTLFSDVDGQTLQYSVEGSDNDMTITLNDDNTITFHPTANWHGQKNYDIKASDGQYAAQYNTTATVLFVNQAPKIDSFAPQSNTVNINENTSQDFTVTASDVDKQPLTYKWTSNGKDVGENASSYKFTSDFTSEGTYSIKVEVSDGSLSVFHTWSLKVKDVPRAPIVTLSGPAPTDKLTSDKPITFSSTATSPDGSTMTYLWTIDNVAVGHDATYTGKLTGGTHTVKLTVTDNKGQVATKTTSVTVKNVSTGSGGSAGMGMMLYALIAVVLVIVVVVIVAMMMMRKKKASKAQIDPMTQGPPPPPQQYYDPNQTAVQGQYPPPPPPPPGYGGQQPPQY